MSKIALIGYYGHQNFGDDLMLYNIINYLNEKNSIDVVTSNKKNTEIPKGKNVNLYETYKSDKFSNLKLFCKVFKGKDYLLWGGGTCFSEEDGVVSPVILSLAKLLGTKIIFIGIGSNKIKSKKNKLKMKMNSLLIDKIYVRDKESMENLSEFFGNNKIVLAEDLAYLYDYNQTPVEKNNEITISLRNLDNYLEDVNQNKLIGNIVNFIENIMKKRSFKEVNILVLDNKIDYDINQKLADLLIDKLDKKIKINFLCENDITTKIRNIQKSEVFLCVRLHGILVSELMGVKTVGIGYSEKVKNYMSRIGSAGYIEIHDVLEKPNLLIDKFEEITANKTKVDVEYQRKEALKNFQFLK